jgi:phosphatidylglycerol:prolipoprotein diacylglycerol transferase
MPDPTLTFTLAAWFHTLDPIALQLGPVAIRWYGLSYVLGFIVAYIILVWLARRSLIAIPAHRVADAMLLLILGVIVGGRVGYALVYDRALLTGFSAAFPFWDLLALHKGGMASHGGMAGVALACYLIARGWKTDDPTAPHQREGRSSLLAVGDAMALCIPFGMLFGRLANFINGELLGAIVAAPGQPAPSWAVRYPQELLDGRHAPALDAAQSAQLENLIRTNASPGESKLQTLAYIVDHADKFRPQLEPLISARHPSQLYQALAEGVFVAVIVWFIARKPRLVGVVSAWWLMLYGVGRVITEIWRLPDAQFADPRPLGLARGQWLSVAMIIIGAIVLAWVIRRGKQLAGAGSGGATPLRHLGWATPTSRD